MLIIFTDFVDYIGEKHNFHPLYKILREPLKFSFLFQIKKPALTQTSTSNICSLKYLLSLQSFPQLLHLITG